MAPPRSHADRVADTRRRLVQDRDCWLATAGPEGPWLVPLSFAWHEERTVMATMSHARAANDIRHNPRVRIALDGSRDVVMITGQTQLQPVGEIGADTLAAFQEQLGMDPRNWAGIVITVTPDRIQAWREENELDGRELLAGGRWLPHDE